MYCTLFTCAVCLLVFLIFYQITCCAVSGECRSLWVGSSTGCLCVWPTRYDRNNVSTQEMPLETIANLVQILSLQRMYNLGQNHSDRLRTNHFWDYMLKSIPSALQQCWLQIRKLSWTYGLWKQHCEGEAGGERL